MQQKDQLPHSIALLLRNKLITLLDHWNKKSKLLNKVNIINNQ